MAGRGSCSRADGPRGRARLGVGALIPLTFVVLALVVGASVSADSRLKVEHKRPLVTIRGLTARPAAGDFCTTRKQSKKTAVTQCVHRRYPLHPNGTLPGPPQALVRIDARIRATHVSIQLVRVAGYSVYATQHIPAKAIDRRHRYWEVRLPRDRLNATDLAVDVYWPSAVPKHRDWGNFWTGLKPVEHWP